LRCAGAMLLSWGLIDLCRFGNFFFKFYSTSFINYLLSYMIIIIYNNILEYNINAFEVPYLHLVYRMFILHLTFYLLISGYILPYLYCCSINILYLFSLCTWIDTFLYSITYHFIIFFTIIDFLILNAISPARVWVTRNGRILKNLSWMLLFGLLCWLLQ
jgi:hypothetical protein